MGHEGTGRLHGSRRRGSSSPKKAEEALALAEAHLRGLAGPAVATLEDLVSNAQSEAVRLGAALDTLVEPRPAPRWSDASSF